MPGMCLGYKPPQHTSLTPAEELNSSIYGMLLYVDTYRSYELLKTVQFWPTLYNSVEG